MIGRTLFLLTILSGCALAFPVDSNQLENEDLKVMKCIVEALADVLSRPRPLPVSEECLVILKTDDRLVTILRRRNFLKELQDIAVQGDQERARLQGAAAAPATQTPQTASDAADRSMLEALGGLGERSILSQKRRTGKGDVEERRRSGGGGEEQEKREDDERPWRHDSGAADDWTEGKADKRKKEEHEEKRENSEEHSEERSEEDSGMKHEKGVGFEEKRVPHGHRSAPKSAEEEEEEKDEKRSPFSPHMKEESDEEEEGGEEAGSQESTWTKRAKGLTVKKKEVGKEAQRQRSHSKEATGEDEEKRKRGLQRSPEEKELQLMIPEAKLGSEENGSGSQKDAESLAAIESELENVAHKLHVLQQRG